VAYLDERENRRKIFMNAARLAGFDPLIAENWYKITTRALLGFKVKYNHPTPIHVTPLLYLTSPLTCG
jgi:hypothetical protein